MCSSQDEARWRQGGCHCGAVRYEVECPDGVEVSSCNCSICTMTGYLHLIVERQRFRLTAGESNLAAYTFNTGTAKHLFCRTCGVKSFYIPRSHPDGVSVNYRCLDDDPLCSARITPFDGRNWEHSIESLRPSASQDGH